MELRIWLLLTVVLLAMFAVIVMGVALVNVVKRVRRLENIQVWQDERLYDLSKSVDGPSYERYELRRAARHINVKGEE